MTTEPQYRAALITGRIALPAPIQMIKSVKKNAEEDVHIIAYRNYHAGLFWRLGELTAESLTEAERKQHMAMVMMITNKLNL